MMFPPFSLAQLAPLQRMREALQRQHRTRVLAHQDWCIRQLLVFWQSELEPEVIYGPDQELLGFGHAGVVTVPLRWIVFSDAVLRS